nr:HTH-type transcriptional repressor FabR [Aeromonas caviae]
MGIRAQQKEKTRRTLIEAAFSQLCANRSFSNLSLREVAREAGIAPTSFYRHFRDMEELGLTLVDEGGLTLRQQRGQGGQRTAGGWLLETPDGAAGPHWVGGGGGRGMTHIKRWEG